MAEPIRQVVVVGPSGPLVDAARALPSSIFIALDDDAAEGFAAAGFELLEGRRSTAGTPTAYVCRDFVCRLPVTDPAAL